MTKSQYRKLTDLITYIRYDDKISREEKINRLWLIYNICYTLNHIEICKIAYETIRDLKGEYY